MQGSPWRKALNEVQEQVKGFVGKEGAAVEKYFRQNHVWRLRASIRGQCETGEERSSYMKGKDSVGEAQFMWDHCQGFDFCSK